MSYYAIVIISSYLLGSIPFGFLIGRMRGIDVRKHGSGNIGATNVVRILGPKWGIMVFMLDAGKGVAAVLLAKWLSQHFPVDLRDPFHQLAPVAIPAVVGGIVASVWCIVGHSFPFWLRFKGGKGVATSAGVMLGLLPLASVASFTVWLIVFFASRYVSLASICAAVFLPVAVLLVPQDPDRWPLFFLALLATVLIIWRHRANIERLRKGTEHRFVKNKS